MLTPAQQMTLGDDSALPLKVSRRAVNFLYWELNCPIYDTKIRAMVTAMQVTKGL